MTIAVLAEKPSVARDIARVVGASQRRQGYLEGGGYRVTWALGHLVELPEPHRIRPEWKRWSAAALPMLPRQWPLEVSARTRDQFEAVRGVLLASDVDEVVCATDAGREGELIFRYIIEATGCQRPMRRLWISSLTPEAIRAGFARLRDAADFQPLADAARGRSRADWIVGMNLTRAYTLAERAAAPARAPRPAAARERGAARGKSEVLSVGRVQTPTLAMLVDRELAIRTFVPEDYVEVEATFQPASVDAGSDASTYTGVYFRDVPEVPGEEAADRALRSRRLPADGELARGVIARAEAGRARIASLEARQRRMPPPQLYDLTELQRHANRLYGFSAQKTLDTAQSLYERHKLSSYPRTDSRHLSEAEAATLPAVVAAIRAPFDAACPPGQALAPDTGVRPLGARFVDDARVTDHHAIIPTGVRGPERSLSRDEARLYEMICARLLSAWQPDHLYSTTTVITEIRPADAEEPADRYRSSGTRVDRIGWRMLEPAGDRPPAAGADPDLPSILARGQEQRVVTAEAKQRRTRPPRALTEATLLTAMETAGRALDDDELSEAMRERGLGTPATRASIIETLLQRGYAVRQQKSLRATDKGIHLIEVVHPDVKSPALTGSWEHALAKIQRGEADLAPFLAEIETFTRQVVESVRRGTVRSSEPSTRTDSAEAPRTSYAAATAPTAAPVTAGAREQQAPGDSGAASPRAARPTVPPSMRRDPPRPTGRKPTPPGELRALLEQTFGFPSFRPFQEAVCRAVTGGTDALLVMPTGAGKSLCYQLPGIARAGTTLVLSPLIALMEDQVAALQALGLAAECIHSGRDRSHSRRVCQEYLAGALDFLFVAPERLRVRGFPEMLTRRGPTLIAVDEAHCISQWGHDFRPDYRMLRESVAKLRPAPVIALTATATPAVQRDIVEQLALQKPKSFVHGFRRTNLGIEIVELAQAERPAAVAQILRDDANRPAIVYAPSRKQSEELAALLAKRCRADVYHAGMTAERRQRVHEAFRDGALSVVVATIAFGMGIDKPDIRTVIHTGLPRSIEGYYQEIGRAGRDGLPARALLLHSFADQRMHEWFLDRDYPAESVVSRVHATLDTEPRTLAEIERQSRLDAETVQRAIEKLWIHGGARVDAEDRATRGDPDWNIGYREQRAHKERELACVNDYVALHACRMTAIVHHFGDREDDGADCGACDICAPEASLLLEVSAPSAAQIDALRQTIRALEARNGQTTGQLFNALARSPLSRNDFEEVVAAGVRGRLLVESADSFERDGKEIAFRRVHLRPDAYRDPDLASIGMLAPNVRAPRSRGGSRKSGTATGRNAKRATQTRVTRGGRTAGTRGGAKADDPSADPTAAPLVEALKEWRRSEAKRSRRPAFRILTDRTLLAIAAAAPKTEADLLAVHGVGPGTAKRHGESIVAIVRRHLPSG